MNEQTFAFLIHPLDPARDVARKYPALAKLPVWFIEFLSIFYPPVYISEIKGVRSRANGQTARGWFIACPLSARMMMRLPPAIVTRKIIQSGRMAERLGAQILGLGAFTSVVGDGGITVNRALRIPVTTGNSYTVATSIQAVHLAARRIGVDLGSATVAIVGAAGAIGSVCARMLAPNVARLLLVGRRADELQRVASEAVSAGARSVESIVDIGRIAEADIVISVTSAVEAVIRPHHLQTGAIICDIARPRDVAREVSTTRKDVLVFEGGVIAPPGDVDFGFDFGFPAGMAYACMAETMALALESRFEPYSLGKNLQLAKIREIDRIATRHGFQLAGLRNFDRALTETEVAAVVERRVARSASGAATAPALV